jgi:hypothetical protein
LFNFTLICVLVNNNNNIIKTKKEKTFILKVVAKPADRNAMQKETEKKLKYKSSCTEIQGMWNKKCVIVSVIVGAAGILTKVLNKNF